MTNDRITIFSAVIILLVCSFQMTYRSFPNDSSFKLLKFFVLYFNLIIDAVVASKSEKCLSLNFCTYWFVF